MCCLNHSACGYFVMASPGTLRGQISKEWTLMVSLCVNPSNSDANVGFAVRVFCRCDSSPQSDDLK